MVPWGWDRHRKSDTFDGYFRVLLTRWMWINISKKLSSSHQNVFFTGILVYRKILLSSLPFLFYPFVPCSEDRIMRINALLLYPYCKNIYLPVIRGIHRPEYNLLCACINIYRERHVFIEKESAFRGVWAWPAFSDLKAMQQEIKGARTRFF